MTSIDAPMDPDRWARLEALFHEASALPTEDLDAFLDDRCGDDPELRIHIERLIAVDASTTALVDRDLAAYASPLFDDEPVFAELAPGTRVGRYAVIEPVGSGGMGTVYRAERADGAYQRQVALKVVRAGRLDETARARFLREREILARLVHPGIATLLDGGLGDAGEPYLVMELVEGRPISEHAKVRGLGVRDRVGLMIQVAEAVDYAHKNLVVHRDLKPSNILVTDAGVVKLLDFGIARILADDLAQDARTRTGRLLLTPAYAAPEQILGRPITTAVDVYAMGAVFYELLTGSRPFGDVGSWHELRRVLESDPPPPSEAGGVARATRRFLDGDLDRITLKALHKDPLRRYASGRDLAEDLRRYLEGRPVLARPDSVAYRFTKLLRRNVAASVAVAALVLAIVLGVAGTLWQSRLATIEAGRRQAVADFVVGVFQDADPDLTPGQPVTAIQLLESGLGRVDELAGGPEVRVDLLVVLGELFSKLGHYDRADSVLRLAVAEAETSLPRRDAAVGDALDALGRHASLVGEIDEAEQLLRSALEARSRDGSEPERAAATRSNLALVLRRLGQTDEASAIYLDLIDRALTRNGGDSLAVASELLGLGQVRQFQEDREEAIRLFRVVRRLKEQAGERDAQLAHTIHNLGVVQSELELYDEADEVHREALELWRWLFPAGHPEIARSLEALGRIEERRGRWAVADSLYHEAIAAWSDLYGDEHAPIASIRANQANLRYFAGDFVAAGDAYRDAVRILRAGGDRNLLSAAVRNLAIIDRERRDYLSADTLLAEALQIRTDFVGPRSAGVAEVYSSVAGLRNLQGRFAEAEESARLAQEIFLEQFERDHRLVLNAGVERGRALVELGRHVEAIGVLEEIHASFVETRRASDPGLGRAALWLGIGLAHAGDPVRARELIEEALPALEAGLGAEAPEVRRARRELEALRRAG